MNAPNDRINNGWAPEQKNPLFRDAGPVLDFIEPKLLPAILLSGIVAVSILFGMVFGKFSKYVDLTAIVVPGAGNSVITSSQSGFIERIYVGEGQLVKKGAPLFLVVAESKTRQGDARDITIRGIKEKQSLNIESMRNFLKLSDEKLSQLNEEERLLQGQLEQAQNQASSKHEAYLTYKADLERYLRLKDGGFVSEVSLNAARRNAANANADWAQSEEAVVELRRQISGVNQSRLNEQASRSETEVQVKKELTGVADETSRANLDAERMIVAPHDGLVAGITFKNGERIEANRTAMLLLPEHGKMLLAGYVLGRDVGLIRKNVAASIRFDAFPYQKYGVYHGVTTAIADVPLKANEIDVPVGAMDQYYYRIEVIPDISCVKVLAACSPLKVGMTAHLRIKTDTRTILEWILDPLSNGMGAPS